MLIGLFDSGIGGVTVLHEALQALPNADYLYYADTDNVPYGTKDRAQVKSYVLKAADFLISRGADVLVVACNTATSVAIDVLRDTYPIPIIGMEPAVKPAFENHKDKRILVTATPLSLKEDKLRRLITRLDCEDIVDFLPLPGLVRFAEDLHFDEETVRPYLDEALSGFDLGSYQTIVLGCTHFIYFRPLFRQLLGGNIDIIDGNLGTVNMLIRTLDRMAAPRTGSGRISWFESGRQVTDTRTLFKFDRLLQQLSSINS